MEEDLSELDLFADTSAGTDRDPYPEYARARRSSPVDQVEQFGSVTTAIYRYADCERALRDPETFASRVYAESMGLVMGPTILQMDGREHVQHRALIAHAFRRKVLADWQRTLIEPTVHTLIDGFAGRGRAELVRQFTFRFPIRIIARMLGIPSEDYSRFARLSIELISIATDVERGLAASRSLAGYLTEIIDQRRREPSGDLISALATAEVDGSPLPTDHILGFLRLLLPAGAETTYRLLGTLLFALLSDKDQLEEVRADRALLEPAIEEALRWEAPVQLVARLCTREVEVSGVALPAGTGVTLFLGSANRDETVFEDPDRYDLHREGPPHLAFAEGPHRCLGEHLARLETTVAMNALLDRLPDLRLDPGDSDPHVAGRAFRSPTSLPVTFSAV